MPNAKNIINRYTNNIEVWEHVPDLKEWEKTFIAGQRHACEEILNCINNDKIPTEWPQKPLKLQNITIKSSGQETPCPFCREEYGIDRIACCQHYDKTTGVYCR